MPEEQRRSGNRLERTVYAVGPAGSAEPVRRLDTRIRNPAERLREPADADAKRLEFEQAGSG